MARQSSVDQLPTAVKEWLDKALLSSNFSGYEQLEAALRERGCTISKSAIHRYGQKIERRFAAIKASTEAARLLTEGASDDQDARSEAVIALIQTEIFDAIINLQEASDEDIDPQDRIALLSKAAKNIGTLANASRGQKKWRLEVEAQARQKLLAEQAEEIDRTVQAGGMNEEQALFWRKKFLGVQ